METIHTFSNAARARLIARTLDEQDVPQRGRQSEIVRRTGISKKSVRAILDGSLPRDLRVAVVFINAYGLDLAEWVTGELQPDELLEHAITMVRAFERGRFGGEPLTDKEFTHLVRMVRRDPARLERFMEDYSTFVERPASRGIFETEGGAA